MSHRPVVEINWPHYVYRIYDAENQLLYIGCARNVEDRLHFHTIISAQSPTSWEIRARMARHTSQKFPTKSAAHAEEIRAIRAEAPLLNRQHNPTRFTRKNGAYVDALPKKRGLMTRYSQADLDGLAPVEQKEREEQ